MAAVCVKPLRQSGTPGSGRKPDTLLRALKQARDGHLCCPRVRTLLVNDGLLYVRELFLPLVFSNRRVWSRTQSDALCVKEVFAYTVSVFSQDRNRPDSAEILSETVHLSEIIIIIVLLFFYFFLFY